MYILCFMICLDFRLLQLSYFCLKNMRTCLNTLYKRSTSRKLYKNQSRAGLFFAATVSVCFEAKGARDGNLILCLYIYIYVLNCPKNCLKIRVYIHAIARAYIVSVIGSLCVRHTITIKITKIACIELSEMESYHVRTA